MIKELSHFVSSLDPEMKALGMKPKEGLHLILLIQEQNGKQFIDDNSLVQYVYTRKKDKSPEDEQFLKKCTTLSQYAWCVNTNKCFDLPIKAIHSCSPYCIALKRENLTGGEKFKSNTKSQVYERISDYFKKAASLLNTEEERQRVRLFENALNSEEKFNAWLEQISEYQSVKDADYIIFYLDEPLENYQKTNERYLADKLFNTNDYNQEVDEVIYGTSDFFNGYPTKKPFLSHQSASFEIAGRISAKEAKDLYEFQDIMGRKILPNPLPIFIHQDEIIKKGKRSLEQSSISLFKKGAIDGHRRTYQEIIEELYKEHDDELGNYYLLYYDLASGIKDFDFVPKFELLLKDSDNRAWIIQDLFGADNGQTITNVFQLHHAVLLPVFNNALITRTKSGDLQFKYFDDLDAKYFKSDATYLLAMQYRRAFYDFIYKSRRQAISSQNFSHILQISILEDIRIDEFANSYHSEDRNIRQKLNIWFSLTSHFISSNKQPSIIMPSSLQIHREFMQKLTTGAATIATDEQYAFAAGQVIYYLLNKSKTADRSYKRLEPFLQQVKSSEMNKAISRLFDSYKHENFSTNFRKPFAELLSYESNQSIRDLIPTMLAGIFSDNELFSSSDKEEISESTE